MASANTTKTANDKLIIFKGDDTGGTFGRPLLFTIEAVKGVDLSGCSAEWDFDGIVKRFDAPLIPGEVREVFYSHNETRCMELGVRFGTFRIIDAAGKVRTLTNTKPVEVTNNAERCYPGSSAASFVIHGIGDMKHSEFADLEEKEGMTLNEVGGMVNTLIRKLKGTVSAVAALLAFGAFADGAITPQTDFGDISPTAKIGTVISDAGAVMTESDPTVYAWAKQPNPPKGMTDNALVLTNGVVKTANGSKTIGAADVGAVPLVEDVLGYKTAVTIGSRKSGEPVGPNSLANGNNVTASGHYSHAEGFYTTASGDNSHAEGNFTTASGYCSHAEGYYAHTKKQDQYAFAWNGDDTRSAPYESNGKGTFNINPYGGLGGFFIGDRSLPDIFDGRYLRADSQGGPPGYIYIDTNVYFSTARTGTLFVDSFERIRRYDESGEPLEDWVKYIVGTRIDANDSDFSNAVLAVGLNIDTNSVAVLNEIAATFGGFPIEGTATTVGGLLAALAAAVAWLKKNKVQTLKLEDGSVETSADGGVAKLDDFFTESNSLLTGTIDAEVISKGTAPDAHLEAPTDEHLKLVLADNSVAYDSAKALPYKLTSAIGDRVIATMTLTAASTDITLPAIAANDTTVKDFILDVTNAYAVEGVATDAGVNIPHTGFKLVTRDGESLTAVTTVKAGKSAFICFTQKSPVVVDGTTYPCWCVIQLPFGDPS